MTNTELSRIIARAILATVERDGACNLANIEDTVFRELAVAEARLREAGPHPHGPIPASERLRNASQAMLLEIRTHALTGKWGCFDDTVIELEMALKEVMA